MFELTIVCITAPLLIFLVNLVVDFIRMQKSKISKKKFKVLTIAKGISSALAGIAAWLFGYLATMILK